MTTIPLQREPDEYELKRWLDKNFIHGILANERRIETLETVTDIETIKPMELREFKQ